MVNPMEDHMGRRGLTDPKETALPHTSSWWHMYIKELCRRRTHKSLREICLEDIEDQRHRSLNQSMMPARMAEGQCQLRT